MTVDPQGSTYQVLASHPLKPSVGVMMATRAGATRLRRALEKRGYRVSVDVWDAADVWESA